VKLMMGLSGAFLAFLLTGLLAQAVLRVSWFLRGQPDFREYQSLALAYELPDGILASHLGIAGLLLFVLLIHRYWHGRKAIWVISVQPGGRWRYLLICFVVAVAVLNVVMWLMRGGNMAWQASQPDWAIYLALILITSPLQAAAEEFFFRGYLQQAIGSLAGRAWVGVACSSLVFAIFHGDQNVALFAHRLGFGLIAGTLVWATGGLEAAIAVHVANNVFAFGYALFTGGVATLKATSAISWEAACSDLASFAVFGALAWWIGRRMHVATLTP
jgi:conserved protein yyaK